MLDELDSAHALVAAIEGVTNALGVTRIPACTLKVSSSIPVASGLGSGAAVSVAVIRALAGYLGKPLPNEQISTLAYEVEKIHHGTPSGIDNTVITFAQPVNFKRELPSPRGRGAGSEGIIETFHIAKPFTIIIADTGISSPTKETVGDVRGGWQAEAARYERLFAAIGSITRAARQAIESGHPERLGPLMNENHELLGEMRVSSPELDRLVQAARAAGALGAKLSGGGRGGNMITLVDAENAETISAALRGAGAVRTILTCVGD